MVPLQPLKHIVVGTMGKIFISYRREDVPGDARGIRDALSAKFGRVNVFMDVDNLLPGRRFDVELAKALDACDVLIAVPDANGDHDNAALQSDQEDRRERGQKRRS